MMTTDLAVPRNGDFYREFQLVDVDGVPIDLTDHVLSAASREIAGGPAVIAVATVVIIDAMGGRFTMRWRGSDFDSIGEETQESAVAYDVRHLFPDGIATVPLRGRLLLIPESTE